MKHLPPIGMRTIKTAVAVTLCMLIGHLLDRPIPILAIIAALLAMRDTVANSLKFGVTRIISIFIGGIFAIAFLQMDIQSLSPWLFIPITGASVLVVIYFTVVIHMPDATAYAVITFMITFAGASGNPYLNVFDRMTETIAGVLIALFVNKYFNPPARKKCGGDGDIEEDGDSDIKTPTTD